ncbi:MAG: septum formation inhibitor Maf [Ruminococcaceae bacterium]|nr:septum formation inhibitor Maf [Oscillospiraceae bacterium]
MNNIKIKLPSNVSVVLASGSPRRRELLEQIGLSFTVVPSQADESIAEDLSPAFAVQSLSLLKAADVAKTQPEDALIIGADTVVVLEEEILTKPQDAQEATEMLRRLSGRSHSVLTGVTVFRRKDGKSVSVTEETQVYFKSLSEDEIASYVATKEPLDKAGSYGIQGLGGLFIEKIEGDYYNVVGLPLTRLGKLLQEEFDIELIWEVI